MRRSGALFVSAGYAVVCGGARPYAAGCGEYAAKSVRVVSAVGVGALLAVAADPRGVVAVAWCLGDPSFGEFVLPHEALGADAEQHVYAVPCPFGYLGRRDSAVEPCREARVLEVVKGARQVATRPQE